jgi:hypothetical protein
MAVGGWMETDPALYAARRRWARMQKLSPRPMVKFLLPALFHGDHPALALRCCASLRAQNRAPRGGRRAQAVAPGDVQGWPIWRPGT